MRARLSQDARQSGCGYGVPAFLLSSKGTWANAQRAVSAMTTSTGKMVSIPHFTMAQTVSPLAANTVKSMVRKVVKGIASLLS